MRFTEALDKLIDGDCTAITRSDWYGTDARPKVYLQTPDENSKMTEPYLYMSKMVKLDDGYSRASVFPLDLSCESVLSDKWTVVD